jgi:hypothetical protein
MTGLSNAELVHLNTQEKRRDKVIAALATQGWYRALHRSQVPPVVVMFNEAGEVVEIARDGTIVSLTAIRAAVEAYIAMLDSTMDEKSDARALATLEAAIKGQPLAAFLPPPSASR